MPKSTRKRQKYSARMDPLGGSKSKQKPPHFQITCLYIGQGDCILIRCPDKKFIMIDCGSTGGLSGHEDEFKSYLKVLLQSNPIDYFIITHSDRDHHNKIKLLGEADILVEKVIAGNYDWTDEFFSTHTGNMNLNQAQITALKNEIASKSNIDIWEEWVKKYTKNRLSALEILHNDCHCNTFVGLTINKEEAGGTPQLVALSKTFDFVNDTLYEVNLPNGYYNVWYGAEKSVEWSIKIIAAQVESDTNDKAGYMNAASLVTVLEYDDKKVIFTGDSTGATFDYLLNHSPQKDLLSTGENVLLQIPHHGSASHHSHWQTFIDETKPKRLFSSVKFNEATYQLPRWEALSRWKRNPAIDKSPGIGHYIGYWITVKELSKKRILNEVNQFSHPDKSTVYITEVEINRFLSQINIGSRKKFNYKMFSLKAGAGNSDRQVNLFALNQKGSKHVFVIQKTKKRITTNGSTTVSKFLSDKVELVDENRRDEPVDINAFDLITNAFNHLDSTKYIFTKDGISY